MADGSAARNLHATAVALRALPRSSMIAAAKAAKRIAVEEGNRAGSPLQGKRKRRGMTLKARDDIRDTGTGATLRVQGVNVAGWVWRNTGTAPHPIRRRRRGPMKVMTVQHPGTSGIGAWRRVQKRCADVIPQVFIDDVHKVVTRRG